ncbi:MAG: hypothetical protein FJZ57_01670 [Chlamydiae bacterium]|nr:hypothetical protein [Chlamydiota bacterium]
MEQKKLLPNPFYTHPAWDENSNPLWPATAFYLHRNFVGAPFPSKMKNSQAVKLSEQITACMLKLQQLQNPIKFKADDLSPIEKDFLYEHFICKEPCQNALKGQSFIVDDTAHFLALINFSDHIQMELVDCKNKWEKAWEILSDIDSAISENFEPCYSSRFGYLTSDHTKCGTGLIVNCYLHLPMLIEGKLLEEACKNHLEESVYVTSLHGKVDEFVGDFVLLENKYTLGLTEEMILRDLHISATKLTLAEQTLREKCKKEHFIQTKDAISRSFGLLKHSYQLQIKEVLDALSKIKLGIDLGWIEGIHDNKINQVFFTCQRAHIGFVFPNIGVDPNEITTKRAEYIHSEMKDVIFKE